MISAVGFFIGVYFAYRTFTDGIVTQQEFDLLQSGQTVVEANETLGFEGQRVRNDADSALGDVVHATISTDATPVPTTIFRWENSTLSFVECEFQDGRLVAKKATRLPR